MGRTHATQVQLIESHVKMWFEFRRALRVEDQPAFDRLWSYVRYHAVPVSKANAEVPMEAFLVAMVLGLALEIQELRKDADQRVDL